MSKEEIHYDSTHITFLEKLWGDGYMSPGGKEEISRLLTDLDLAEQKILDIGCGAGGITVSLVKDHGAKQVVGVDVEEDVVNVATERVLKNGLNNNIVTSKIKSLRISSSICLKYFSVWKYPCRLI